MSIRPVGSSLLNLRVELHPGTDAWMMGDRYGVVLSVTPTGVRVKCDRSGRTRTLPYGRVLDLDGVALVNPWEA